LSMQAIIYQSRTAKGRIILHKLIQKLKGEDRSKTEECTLQIARQKTSHNRFTAINSNNTNSLSISQCLTRKVDRGQTGTHPKMEAKSGPIEMGLRNIASSIATLVA